MDELLRKMQATWPTAEQLEQQRAEEKCKEHDLAVKQEAIREANGDFSQAPGLNTGAERISGDQMVGEKRD